MLRARAQERKLLNRSGPNISDRWLQRLRYRIVSSAPVHSRAYSHVHPIPTSTGKSTLAKILLRIDDFDKGSLVVNDVDIRRYNPAEYHSHLSAVFQGFSKFSTTVKENVGLGNVEKIGYKSAVEAAVHLAEADTLVESLPNGLKTMLETPGFESFSFGHMGGSHSEFQRHGLSGGEVRFISL